MADRVVVPKILSAKPGEYVIAIVLNMDIGRTEYLEIEKLLAAQYGIERHTVGHSYCLTGNRGDDDHIIAVNKLHD